MSFTGELRPYQPSAVSQFLDRGNLLVAYEMGLGKMQPVDEPVLTPDGWRAIGSLSRGDLVIGGNGKPTEVVAVFPQKDRRVYKVTMNDGSFTYAGPDHLWSVQHNNDTVRSPDTWRTLSTETLLSEGLRSASGNLLWKIPVVPPVSFSCAPVLPIHPYVLGLWLGDGSSDGGGFTTADAELIDIVNAVGYETTKKKSDRYGYYIKGLLPALRSLGLLHNKHIPQDFLLAFENERLSLLQGLMDSDGTVRSGGSAEFCSSSKILVDQVVSLVQSLGGIARVSGPRVTSYTHSGEKRKGKPSYRVGVKLPEFYAPFRLRRKADLFVPPTKYPPSRRIQNIERVEDKDTVCIKVRNPDGLYVTRGFIVTHNTPIAIAAAEDLFEREEIDCCVIVCAASLKYQWARALAKFTDLPTEEKKLKQRTITIAGLVIDGPPEKRKAQYTRLVEENDYIIMSYENVVNDWKYVKQIKPDMIVLDEATAIKSFRAKRTRKIKQFTAPYRLALTGTPVENRPEEIYSIMQWVDSTVLGRYDLFDKTYIVRNKYGGVKKYKNLKVLNKRLSPALSRKRRTDPDVAPYLPDVEHEVWEVQMDPPTRRLYTKMAEDLLVELADLSQKARPESWDVHKHYFGSMDEGTLVGKVMAVQQALEMLLDHPDLLVYSAMDFEAKVGRGSKYVHSIWRADLVDDVIHSRKLKTLGEKLEPIMEWDDNKVIIFTTYVDMLDIMSDELPYKAVVYHGGMDATAKAEAVATFTEDPECRLFLSSHAGAYGTDLYMANYLINYDLPWSAGKSEQINARHVRASSEFEKVFVIDMVTEGTVEERKHLVVRFKRRVGEAILDGEADERGTVTNDVDSLTAYLLSFLED